MCKKVASPITALYRTQKIAKNFAIWAPSHNFVGL